MDNFRNKTVLLTGGSSGIGLATALRLAELGGQLAIAARGRDALDATAQQVRDRGGQALTLPTDVTDSEQVRLAVEATVAHFGKLDILICSAGLSMRTYFEGSSLEAMERIMRVNFFGTLYATHFALPHVKRTKGSLVAVSSLTGKRGIPSYSIYGASKFAVQGLYDALELELARDGVHVGVFSPGFVDTPLRHKVLGPSGEPWVEPPQPPFRIWTVEKCAEVLVRMLAKRKRQALLPWYTGPLLVVDELLGRVLGSRLLSRHFPPDAEKRPPV